MDEKVIEASKKYMEQVAQMVGSARRFPCSLPEDQGEATALLLGAYTAIVQSRGRSFDLDKHTISKIESVVKWFYKSQKNGLLLCGTMGNGKTTMINALKSIFGSYAECYEAVDIFDSYKKDQTLPVFPSNKILLIDDLGVEPATYNEFGEKRYPLTELLMKRYRVNGMTVIATNLTFDEIGKIYGDRLQDRMREMFAMITYTEPSYRK